MYQQSSTLLDRVLAPGGISSRFQAIVSLAPGAPSLLHGVECLSRGPEDTHLAEADVLFAYARCKNAEAAVDRRCIEQALFTLARRRDELPSTMLFHLNVHIATLARDLSFVDFLLEGIAAAELNPNRFVVELLEFSNGLGSKSASANLRRLGQAGIKLALDDLGSRDGGLRMLLDLPTDFVKIDRYFVNGVHRDSARQAMLSTLAMLASRMGSQVVAEGVEDDRDLELLVDLGVHLIQGYVFSQPVEDPRSLDGDLATLMRLRSDTGLVTQSSSAAQGN